VQRSRTLLRQCRKLLESERRARESSPARPWARPSTLVHPSSRRASLLPSAGATLAKVIKASHPPSDLILKAPFETDSWVLLQESEGQRQQQKCRQQQHVTRLCRGRRGHLQ